MSNFRFHVINLPHTQLTKNYSTCAYTEKVRKFARMMREQGHEVLTYVNSVGNQKKHGFNGPEDYLKIDFNDPKLWPEFNERVIKQMKKNIKPKDFICVITGTPVQAIKDAFPDNITVEFGVGYKGVMNPSFRVFESHAWRNYVYGRYDLDGAFYDEVIPNYFEVEDFPFQENKSDYYLFVGRIDANKGLNIAQDVCERLDKRLIVAGPGTFKGYGEYVGVVGSEERGKLMSQATALFCPTLYVPPFEGVHVEALLCGTPVITTDFGVFTETVENGVNGYRCKNLAEFMNATNQVKDLSPQQIRKNAIAKYSLESVGKQYEDYFKRLSALYDGGWYATTAGLKKT